MVRTLVAQSWLGAVGLESNIGNSHTHGVVKGSEGSRQAGASRVEGTPQEADPGPRRRSHARARACALTSTAAGLGLAGHGREHKATATGGRRGRSEQPSPSSPSSHAAAAKPRGLIRTCDACARQGRTDMDRVWNCRSTRDPAEWPHEHHVWWVWVSTLR